MKIEIVTKEPRLVEDWEITYSNGSALAVTLDSTLGDSITVGTAFAEFHLSEKPSHVNPDDVLAAEDLLIPLANVNCLRKRVRLMQDPTLEEKEEWQRILNELTDPDSLKH